MSSRSPQGRDFGPLAVVAPSEGRAIARGGEGPVRIEDACVTMTVENGDVLLLVWRADEVLWDESERLIAYTNAAGPDATPIMIRDGDTITVGGELLEDGAPISGNLIWLATPRETCNGRAWLVNGLTTP